MCSEILREIRINPIVPAEAVLIESDLKVLSFAMAIEVQALDLYLRSADGSNVRKTRDTRFQVANEERDHITRLRQHIDQQQELE